MITEKIQIVVDIDEQIRNLLNMIASGKNPQLHHIYERDIAALMKERECKNS